MYFFQEDAPENDRENGGHFVQGSTTPWILVPRKEFRKHAITMMGQHWRRHRLLFNSLRPSDAYMRQ